MRRPFWMLLLVLVLVTGCARDSRSYSAERYDVDINVQRDGALHVTETVVLEFDGGPFQYVFREIPTERTDGITGFQAFMDGTPLPEGTDAGEVEIEGGGDDVRVTWHFAPTSDATHTFTLNYEAAGVVRQEPEADLLVWDALPTEHDYPIDASQVRVTYPEAAELAACPGVESTNAQIASGEQQATFTARNLEPDAPFCVTLSFAPGSVLSAPPRWQAREVELRPYAPLANRIVWGLGLGSLLILGGGLLWLASFWQRHRHATGGATMPHLTTLPGDLPPALAGALNGTGAQPSWTNAAATIFDLARRGVLRLEPLPKSRWGTQEVLIHLECEPVELRPHERGLLELLFTDKKGRKTTVKASELAGRAGGSNWKRFAEPLKQEMDEMGFISAERLALRKQLQRAATVTLLLAALAIPLAAVLSFTVPVVQSVTTNPGGVGYLALFSVGISLFFLSLILYSAAAAFSPLSEAGAEVARRWRGFIAYLRDVVKGREPFARADLFESYLPYVASYGMTDAWVKFFNKKGEVPTSPWLRSLDMNGDGSIAAIAVISAAGGGGGGGGAAAGAAGGGASGAG